MSKQTSLSVAWPAKVDPLTETSLSVAHTVTHSQPPAATYNVTANVLPHRQPCRQWSSLETVMPLSRNLLNYCRHFGTDPTDPESVRTRPYLSELTELCQCVRSIRLAVT